MVLSPYPQAVGKKFSKCLTSFHCTFDLISLVHQCRLPIENTPSFYKLYSNIGLCLTRFRGLFGGSADLATGLWIFGSQLATRAKTSWLLWQPARSQVCSPQENWKLCGATLEVTWVTRAKFTAASCSSNPWVAISRIEKAQCILRHKRLPECASSANNYLLLWLLSGHLF